MAQRAAGPVVSTSEASRRADSRPDRLEVVRVDTRGTTALRRLRRSQVVVAAAVRAAHRASRRALRTATGTPPVRRPRLTAGPVTRRRALRLGRNARTVFGWAGLAAALTVLVGSVSGVHLHRIGVITFPGILAPWTAVRVLDIGLYDLLTGLLLTGLAALGRLAAGYLRRHQQLAGGEGRRAEADQRSVRFGFAVEQLGHERAAVRLAGVYALGRLADDWPQQQQMCIDVLCAYLRLPYEADPGSARHVREDREVRQTVIRVIRNHLLDPAAVSSWCGRDLDFTGAVFDGGSFDGIQVTAGEVRFDACEFVGGSVGFAGARLTGGSLSFDGARFSAGRVSFTGAQFGGTAVSFDGSWFCGGTVGFADAVLAAGSVRFTGAAFSAGRVTFASARFCGARVAMDATRLAGGTVGFTAAEFSAGGVDFTGAEFSGATVGFAGAAFSGADVTFEGCRFSAGTVGFTGAGVTGGRISWGPFSPLPGGREPDADAAPPMPKSAVARGRGADTVARSVVARIPRRRGQ